MEIDKSVKSECALIFTVDVEEILMLCYLDCGPRLLN